MSQLITSAFTFLGTTDSVTECGCCGRANLKSTVALQDTQTGAVVYFGSACGAKAIGWGVKVFNAAAKQADADIQKAAQRLFNSIYGPAYSAELEGFSSLPSGLSWAERRAQVAPLTEAKAMAHSQALAAVVAAFPLYNITSLPRG